MTTKLTFKSAGSTWQNISPKAQNNQVTRDLSSWSADHLTCTLQDVVRDAIKSVGLSITRSLTPNKSNVGPWCLI